MFQKKNLFLKSSFQKLLKTSLIPNSRENDKKTPTKPL